MGARGTDLAGAEKVLTVLGRLFRLVLELLTGRKAVFPRQGMNPQRLKMNPQWLEMNPQRLKMNPQRLKMNPQRLKTNPQRLKMNPQRLKTNPQWLKMNPQQLEMNPQWLEMSPLGRTRSAEGQGRWLMRCVSGPAWQEGAHLALEALPAGGRDDFPNPKLWDLAGLQPLTIH